MSDQAIIIAFAVICWVITFEHHRITAIQRDAQALQRHAAELTAENAQLRSNVELLIASSPPSVLAGESLSTGRTLRPLAKKIGEKNGPQQR